MLNLTKFILPTLLLVITVAACGQKKAATDPVIQFCNPTVKNCGELHSTGYSPIPDGIRLIPPPATPTLEFFQPTVDSKGNAIYRIRAEKGWTCKAIANDVNGEADTFNLICHLRRKR